MLLIFTFLISINTYFKYAKNKQNYHTKIHKIKILHNGVHTEIYSMHRRKR